ncbi:hypothetical protein AB0I10_11950 [Streptomyces sp. NPDC050636]|uniref:hypothetical protein n=1 Tax=Streptomyces sp. NPDC050636 TaxID=3154510 RepID=UPI00344327F3
MPAHTDHDRELYEALIAERWGRPLAAILEEAAPRPVNEVLRERHRRPALPSRPAAHIPSPDPNAAEHCALALAETAPRRRRP